jgi:glycosyltransferase involved in cell wall biosynthesis
VGPLFTVVIPTRGDLRKISSILDALELQTLSREDREIVLAFDGVAVLPEISDRCRNLGARFLESNRRRGPGAARNLGARGANGTYLAFTEDDCIPAPEWLEAAAARIEQEPELDVLEGATVLPDGRPARRGERGTHHFLPTNLFVRRETFERLGGYNEEFYDGETGIYFREDSDFGFSLEEAGARMATEPRARVVHPTEHPGFWDPIRWARRYEMDALLRTRHPRRFRERMEAHRVGPFTLRRPLVRASWIYALALGAAGIGAATHRGWAVWALVVAALCLIPIWAKWRYHPARLPVLPVVPLVLVYSAVAGRARVSRRSRRAN